MAEQDCSKKWKEEYECYLEKEKCRQEKLEKEEMNKPDNTYGMNPYVYEHSRDRVYMNYTGKDRLKW